MLAEGDQLDEFAGDLEFQKAFSYFQGVADALDMTVLTLFDEEGLIENEGRL